MGHRRRFAARAVLEFAHDELDFYTREGETPCAEDLAIEWEWFVEHFDENDIYRELLACKISNTADAIDWAIDLVCHGLDEDVVAYGYPEYPDPEYDYPDDDDDGWPVFEIDPSWCECHLPQHQVNGSCALCTAERLGPAH
jgi:hypothetical protein